MSLRGEPGTGSSVSSLDGEIRQRPEGEGGGTRPEQSGFADEGQRVPGPGPASGTGRLDVPGVGHVAGMSSFPPTSSFIFPGGTYSLLSRGVWFRQGESSASAGGPGRANRHSEPRGPASPGGVQPQAAGGVRKAEPFRAEGAKTTGQKSAVAARPRKPSENGE